MKNISKIKNAIFTIKGPQEFLETAIEIFHYQYKYNRVYRKYCDYLKTNLNEVNKLEKIPFLPIEFFKTKDVVSAHGPFEKTFTSSGTTGMVTSRHFVKDYGLYEESYLKSFQMFYGNPESYCILALLPSYLEREGSSLVDMAHGLIERSSIEISGTYLYEHENLKDILFDLEAKGQKTILLGVTFALLDFAEKYPLKLKNTILMETGGMKGRRKEITRKEVHHILQNTFGISSVHSEYGMTELLSQAYSQGEGIYRCPPWMKVMVRERYDPFSFVDNGKTGGINIIDLANIHSCSFVETKDLGKKYEDDGFEVSGRFDNSDIRGCNLLIDS